MLTRRRQYQRLLDLRVLQERVEEEKVTLAHLRVSNLEVLIDEMRRRLVTSVSSQIESMGANDANGATIYLQAARELSKTLSSTEIALELRKQQYAESVEIYFSARLERSRASSIAAASDRIWKDYLRRREQIIQDDAFLSKRSQPQR